MLRRREKILWPVQVISTPHPGATISNHTGTHSYPVSNVLGNRDDGSWAFNSGQYLPVPLVLVLRFPKKVQPRAIAYQDKFGHHNLDYGYYTLRELWLKVSGSWKLAWQGTIGRGVGGGLFRVDLDRTDLASRELKIVFGEGRLRRGKASLALTRVGLIYKKTRQPRREQCDTLQIENERLRRRIVEEQLLRVQAENDALKHRLEDRQRRRNLIEAGIGRLEFENRQTRLVVEDVRFSRIVQ